jgi:GTP-binding protein LepA
MDLERERGITIKAQAVRLPTRRARTAGLPRLQPDRHARARRLHLRGVRSLAACEGALLVVDASQGVEAQTLANVYLALDNNLEIVPVLNKIDLPSAEPEVCARRSKRASASTRIAVLKSRQDRHRHRRRSSRPSSTTSRRPGRPDAPLRALIFDSWYDNYRGVIALVRVIDGTIKRGHKIRLMATERAFEVLEVGAFTPTRRQLPELIAGEVGFVIANIKEVRTPRSATP